MKEAYYSNSKRDIPKRRGFPLKVSQLCLIALWLMAATLQASCQSPSPTPTRRHSPPKKVSEVLQLRLLESQFESIGAPAEFTVVFHNTDPSRAVEVTTTEFRLHPDIKATRTNGIEQYWLGRKDEDRSEINLYIEPGRTVYKRITLNREYLNEKKNLMTAAHYFFFRSKPRPLILDVGYWIQDENEPAYAYLKIEVNPRASVASILIGGWIGVLLALLVRKLRDQERLPNLREIEWPTFFLGCFACSLAIVVFHFTDSATRAQIPLSLNASDFINGLVLGLFFDPIAKWLLQTVGGNDNKTDTEKAIPDRELNNKDG